MIVLHLKAGLLGEHCRQIELPHREGLTPRQMAAEYAARSAGGTLEVLVDGQRCVSDEDWDRPIPDGAQVWAIAPTTYEAAAAVFTQFILPLLVSAAVSYLVSLLSPRPKPPGVPKERGDETSQTYGWQIETQYGQGFPIAWGYGRHALGGQCISSNQALSGSPALGQPTQDRLRLVLALCEGPIRRIGDVVADEIDGLGGFQGMPGAGELPRHISINGIQARPADPTEVSWNITTGNWSSTPALFLGAFVEAYNSALTVRHALLQLTRANNSTFTDLDLIVIEGALPTSGSFRLVFAGSRATTTSYIGVIRSNPLPGVKAWLRPGTMDQRPLPEPFSGPSVLIAVGGELNNRNDEVRAVYANAGKVGRVTLSIMFPGGLYLTYAGAVGSNLVIFQAQWRPVGTSAWREFYVDGRAQSQWQISRSSVRAVQVDITAELVAAGQPRQSGPIEFRVRRESVAGDDNVQSAAVWRSISIGSPLQFAYPRLALLALDIPATSQWNGGLPNITVRCDLALVRVWDPVHGFSPRCWDRPAAPFDFMPANATPGRNPAWVLGDFLTSPWGLGKWLRDSDVDWPSLRRWAAFCDADPSPSDPWGEPQCQVDLVGDRPRPAWEWVLDICAAGRATPVWRNGKIGVVYHYRDAHSDATVGVPAKAPLQLFTSGNIEDLQVTWPPRANRATVLLCQFLNEEQNYAQDVLPVHDPEASFDDPGALRRERYRPEPLQVYGVTRPGQVWREGIFRHRAQRLIRREISFRTGRWALAAEVGDLIQVEHEGLRPFGGDVPLNMVVRTGGTAVTSIVVDHACAGAQQIVVRDPDGKPQHRAITGTSVSGQLTTLTLAAAVTCAAGATCVVGLTDKLVETYEIVTITLAQDQTREIRAVQWAPAMYDEVTRAMFEAGAATDDEEPPTATALLGRDATDVRVIPLGDGAQLVTWARNPGRSGLSARVYLRDLPAGDWRLLGATEVDEIRAEGLRPWHRYEVSVCVPGPDGAPVVPEAGARWPFAAEEFPPIAPSPVSHARCAQLGELLLLQWDPSDQVGLDYFEVRLGSSWAAGRVLHRERTPRLVLPRPPAGGTAMIAARGTSGLYSRIVALQLPAWAPPETEQVATADEVAGEWGGTHDGTTVDGGGHLVLAAGVLRGTYTGAEVDVGWQGPVYWQVDYDPEEVDDQPWSELGHVLLGSGEARWHLLAGRPASAGRPGVDWGTRLSDVTMTLEDLARHPDLTVRGRAGEVGSHTRVFVESRIHTDGAWSSWREHEDRQALGRKIQVRVTLERESKTWSARVTRLQIAGHV